MNDFQRIENTKTALGLGLNIQIKIFHSHIRYGGLKYDFEKEVNEFLKGKKIYFIKSDFEKDKDGYIEYIVIIFYYDK